MESLSLCNQLFSTFMTPNQSKSADLQGNKPPSLKNKLKFK